MRDQPHRRRLWALVPPLVLLVVAAGAWLVWDALSPALRPGGPELPRGPLASELSPTAHEMTVAGTAREPGSRGVVLVLQETGRGRYLLLTIGEAEALAIATGLEGMALPRPLTHDLMLRTMGELRAQVVRVVITDLREGTYYANLVVRVDDREIELDSRPSDAVALALRAQAPIYAEAALLDRAAVSSEQPF